MDLGIAGRWALVCAASKGWVWAAHVHWPAKAAMW